MSAQIDRFVRDRLPPPGQLPIFRYDLPELQLDKATDKGFAASPCRPAHHVAMDRRRFLLTSLAGALTAPLAAEGQRAGRSYRIGILVLRGWEGRPC